MAELGDQIAAVITEPVMLNTGCILPEDGFLQLLRDRTREHGALLIFDEVITGFRFARGGGQEFFGVMPDITTMAKGLGGGFPVAAIGGTRDGDVRDRRRPLLALRHVQLERDPDGRGVGDDGPAVPRALRRGARARAVVDGRAHGAAGREGRAVACRRARDRVPGVVHGRAGPQLARRRAPDRRGAVRPVVEGDARRAACSSTRRRSRTCSCPWRTRRRTSRARSRRRRERWARCDGSRRVRRAGPRARPG